MNLDKHLKNTIIQFQKEETEVEEIEEQRGIESLSYLFRVTSHHNGVSKIVFRRYSGPHPFMKENRILVSRCR